jgi:MEMO1 family protein
MILNNNVRPSPIAGTWYESDAYRLAKQIDGFIQNAHDAELKGRVIGLVTPHDGHRYSGRTAGYAYKCILGETRDLVVIVAPMHAYYPGTLVTSAHSAYTTPLGEVPLAHDEMHQLELLLTGKNLPLEHVLRDEEHSIEIQLPFLQRALKGNFLLLPLMLRARDFQTIQRLAEALIELLQGKNALLIASTDLSHFFPLEIAQRLDAEMLKHIKSFDPQAVLDAEESGNASACGAAAVATVLLTARGLGAQSVSILNYSTSADSSGDTGSVVGYGSAALTAMPT